MNLVGTTVGRIRIVEALGRGGMGEVYVGWDETLKRKVALKAIRDERRLEPEAKARFLREARILSQLDHPNICRIYEFIEGDDSDFLVLELIDGESLKEAMDRDDIGESFKLHVAERVTDALVAAHEKGVAHRDLKPENVMLTPDGGVKVLDFGLAYTVDGELVTALGGDAGGASSEVPAEPTMLWSGEPPTPEPGNLATTRPGLARPGPARPGLAKPGMIQPIVPRWADSGDAAATQPGTVRPPSPARQPSDDVAATQPGTLRRTAPGEVAASGNFPGSLPGSPTATVIGTGAGGTDAADAALTQRGTVMGTVAYMSPEQARGERATEAGDMYSLGLLLQELFTGRQPYEPGLELLQLLVKAGNGQTLPVTGLDPDLTELIERLKSLAPGARPTAAETAERLLRIRGKPARRLLRRLAAVFVAALLFAGLKYTLDLRRQERLAEAARLDAEQALDFLVDLFVVSDPHTAQGSIITARELLDAGAARIAGELSGQPLSQARLMLTIGQVYRQLGVYDSAEPLLSEALAIRRRLLGDDHVDTAVALGRLANLYHDLGDYDRAEPLFLRALEIQESALGAESESVAASLNNLAYHYSARGDDGAAEPLFLRALEIQQKVHGGEHPDVASSLVNLGDLYRVRGEHERAEPFLRRAIEVQEKLLSPGDPSLAPGLTNLAMIHLEQGEAGLAEPLFRRALDVLQKALGPEHADVAIGLNNLAELYRGTGEYAQAEPLYLRALEIQEQALEAGHPSVAITFANLADLHSARGEIERAGPLYERAVAIQEEALGPDHPGVAVTLNHQADLLLAAGDAAGAEPLFLRALEIQEAVYGPDHPSVAITLADLAGLALGQGRHEEAERLYLRAQASARQALNERQSRAGRVRLAAIRVGLGELYQAAGAGERAAESWGRAVALMEPLAAGEADMDQLHVHAMALLHLGRVDEARPMVEKLLAKGWADPGFLELCRKHGLENLPSSA